MIAQAASSRAGGLSLDTNAKGFFALSNALLDASIATWNTKVLQDTVRPISYIRWLYRGRQIKGWTGPGTKTTTIDGGSWIPYQEANVVTPPFGEYTSGHSAFSGASQRICNLVAGNDTFKVPLSVTITKGRSVIEPGLVPAKNLTLTFKSFTDAANSAGMSRRYGGIHFEPGDRNGRTSAPRSAARPGPRPRPTSTAPPAAGRNSGTPRACVGGCGPEQAWLGWAIRSSAGSGLRWRTRTRRPLGFGAAKPTEALGSDTCAPPPHSTRCWPFPVPMWPGGVHPGRDRGRAAPPSAAAALPVRLVHPRGLDRSTRRWRHLDLGAARLYLQAEIRRLACRRCGRVRTETVAWARPAARFTRDFEDVVADLAQRTDKTTSPGCCAAPGRRSPRSWCGWSLPT